MEKPGDKQIGGIVNGEIVIGEIVIVLAGISDFVNRLILGNTI
ncbi:hypothetical protein yberc0001_24930 [Yersinia bercovieri ATCC 43970]|uniref:Uncharacterized protein n=1 Tax=Yersinia bercovieri ATCC 43970 TaxID=349968 RepID=A0ABP2DXK7_YERBE|nr:hypothetical protein yberc0001_24930 [Yersinia bercovieri ATCC 43970]